ncbi:MAG: hypothetical protein NTZ90_00215 [Proteobacteria bacterium]|nr:hypothetical protein [Pseudomonadota bacterium]
MTARRLLLTVILLAATKASAEVEAMRPTEVNGYEVVDAQYLPFLGSATFRYPGDALFGFYPAGATIAAKQCAYTSFNNLLLLFFQNRSELRSAAELGATRRFVMWTNDYTQSNQRTFYHPSRIWHTGANSRDYKSGTWVWEATQGINGVCEQPTDAQLKAALMNAMQVLSGHRLDD